MSSAIDGGTTDHDHVGRAPQTAQVDVVIVGAGPVGLTLANILGLQNVRTLVVDERNTLIDYPRGVGLDDESLRTFQSIGLVTGSSHTPARIRYCASSTPNAGCWPRSRPPTPHSAGPSAMRSCSRSSTRNS